mmetsp:Transcript_15541/g.31442  ORF Transcript_15541/g.31442 Transcript_15541/m.31442 type:complete len:160 (-) Transcript_15541:861-1340(-)
MTDEVPSNEIRLPPSAGFPVMLVNFLSIFMFLMMMFSGFTKLTTGLGFLSALHTAHVQGFEEYRVVLFGGSGKGMDATSLRVLVATSEIFLGSMLLTPQAGLPAVGLAVLMAGMVYCHVKLGHPNSVTGIPVMFLGCLLVLLYQRRRLLRIIADTRKSQ